MQPKDEGDLAQRYQIVGEHRGGEPDRGAQRTEVRNERQVHGEVDRECGQDVDEVPGGTPGHGQYGVHHPAAGGRQHRQGQHHHHRYGAPVRRSEQSQVDGREHRRAQVQRPRGEDEPAGRGLVERVGPGPVPGTEQLGQPRLYRQQDRLVRAEVAR